MSRVREKSIIELYNSCIASPVGIQQVRPDAFRVKILIDLLAQQSPVRVSETINTLFHIAHDKVEVARSEAFLDQRPEVLPLHARGILELVHHVMLNPCSRFFIDKG